AIKAARLGRIEGHNLGCTLFDDLDDIVRIPGAFVGHHRSVDRARHLGKTFDTLDRLFEVDEVVSLHAAEGPDRLARRPVALVGVAAERHACAHGLANPANHVDVAVAIDPDFDLDGPDSLFRNLRDLALRLGEIHQ